MNRCKPYRIFCVMTLVITLLITCLLAGCGGLPVSAASNPIRSQAAPKIDLQPCVVGEVAAKCGSLRVPEDRAHPEGRALDLNVVVVPARGPEPEPDPLFFISGGPGGIATSANYVSVVLSAFRDLNAKRDIVYVDQRGTNGNHNLTCEVPDSFNNDVSQEQLNGWMKQCLANLNGDPRFYTTIPAMQDLDAARAALGYAKINLYGGSYGTKAVQVYTMMFPKHTRAAVAYHGNALHLPLYPTRLGAAQAALDRALTYCEQDQACHAAYPDIRGDWTAVLDRLANGPVATSYTPPGQSEPFSQTKEGLEVGLFQLLYEGNYRQVPFTIHMLATQEDWTPVIERFNQEHPASDKTKAFQFMPAMIQCFEPAEVFGTVASPLDPSSFYYDAYMTDARGWQKMCAALPKPDPALIYRPGPPIRFSMLLLNSYLDPIFPPSSMDLAVKEFTRSRVVAEPTEGHDTFGSICTWSIVTRYIEKGSVDGLDTSCLDEIKPWFVTVSD